MRVIRSWATYRLIGVLFLCSISCFAQDRIFFTPNRGQWDARIEYQLEIPGGYFYLEKNAHTYYFLDRPHHHPDEPKVDAFRCHAFKTIFKNANPNPVFVESNPTTFYYNYFIGNDASKWKSGIYNYKKITYTNLYNGIDYVIGETKGDLKSDYIVHAGHDPSMIQIEYQGVDQLKIKDGKLLIKTSLAEVVENVPVAYQVINGTKVPVACEYVLKGNTVSFKTGFYNPSVDLIIDPVLYFSTYIGATADNFGCTATYDKHKNLYGGALVYAAGVYPTTLGAFMTAFSGGTSYRDMGITKFDSTGTTLMFSTYLGGSNGTEVPHSLVVDSNDELFVFGSTGSNNYPITGGAYDATFNGGTSVSAASQGLSYPSGTDIVISKFNAAGTALLASTYLGGTGNDGVNNSASLNYNYGDFIRGEIIVDNLGNPILCSTTTSTNFPVTGGAPQTVYGGGVSDAVATKLNSTLTAITWSTYFGGNADDAGFGIQPDLTGNLFFTGVTLSPNFPVTAGIYDNSYNGGVDGYLVKLSAGGALMASTYVGTAGYDQSYLIQTDLSNDIYICGQTTGAYPQTAGIYNNGNSGQFIHKFNNSLTVSDWSTRIGRNSGQVDISPTAFLVNNCYKIFICGWGGTVNTFGLADFSTTTGMPITPGSFQTTTDGSDFYLAIFSKDMAGLEYATFFGGPTSAEHVDGGTARFDKDGYVYQAVCAGCGGHDDFPTTPGAWSATNNSSNCNLAVFKFNMDIVTASTTISAVSPMCTVPYSFNFTNTSTFTDVFYWDFGDGTSDTTSNPTHAYPVPGNYTIMLVAVDTTPCGKNDTIYHNVTVPAPLTLPPTLADTICLGTSSNVDVTMPGVTYVWTPASTVSNPTGGLVDLTPTTNTTYTVVGTNADGCTDTLEIPIVVVQPTTSSFSMTFDTCHIPATFSFTNTSTGAVQYHWDFGDGTTSSLANPGHVYNVAGNYVITLVTIDTSMCGFNDTMLIPVFVPAPLVLTVTGDNEICLGETTQLTANGGGSTFIWTPSGSLDFPNVSNPNATPTSNTTYDVYATDTNGCSDTASFPVTVIQPPTAGFTTDFTPCFIPASVALNNTSTGGFDFVWQLDGIEVNATDLVHVFDTPGTYTITLIAVDTSSCGFNDTISTTIFLPPPAVASAWGTDTICIGLSLQLYASGGVTYQWYPSELYADPTAQNPILTPPGTGNYTVMVTDTNGCTDTASVPVYVFPVPDVDAGNDLVYDMGEGPTFNPTFPAGGSYYWSPPYGLSCTDCEHPEATPEVSTMYYLNYTDVYGCHFLDSLMVMVTPSLYVPNSFTPNGDGTNEFFLPIPRNLSFYELYIFDRWGELIFYTDQQDASWDGRYKNINCKTDVYVWKIKYASQLEPEIFREARGHVSLLR